MVNVESKIFDMVSEDESKSFSIASYYSVLKTPEDLLNYLNRDVRKLNNFKKRYLVSKDINEKNLNKINKDIWTLTMDLKSGESNDIHIFCQEDRWTFIVDVPKNIRNIFANILKNDIFGLEPAWLEPNDLDGIVEKYVKDYQNVRRSMEFDPFYIPKGAKIPKRIYDEMQESQRQLFEPGEISVSIKAPKYRFDEVFNKVFRERGITETIKTEFKVSFENPGESELSLNEDFVIEHKRGNLEATEKIYNDVSGISVEKIKPFKKVLSGIKREEDDEGRIDITFPEKFEDYTITIPHEEDNRINPLLVETMFNYGQKAIGTYGYIITKNESSFMSKIFYPKDGSELILVFNGSKEESKLKIDPVKASPLSLIHIYRIIKERVKWGSSHNLK